MGSPISPIVENLYMEDFEVKAINTSPHPSSLWKRFVDDTFVVIKSAHKRSFLDHINSLDQHIQFASEDSRTGGSMLFLDILVTPRQDDSLSTAAYRKPTHTDLYLQWDSHHTISSKYSVVGILHHRVKTICSNPMLLQQEDDNLFRVLTKCNYPAWALNRVKIKTRTPAQNNKRKGTNNSANNNRNNQNPYMVVPYYKGLSESLKGACSKHGVQVYFKGGITSKILLVAPKDKVPILKKSGVIHRYKCDRVECDEEYIGESSRTFEKRLNEHQKAPFPIYDHYNIIGHNISIDNFSTAGREDQNLIRTIKEALYIRVNNPSLNRNIGKHHLPHIWDEVLLNTSERKLK